MTHAITSPPATPVTGRALWLVLLVVLLADGLDLIDSTITSVAAPSIVADIGGGPALVKWLGASYALALGSTLVLGGRLGDRYGQRRVFLLGMAGFTLASAAAGLALDPAVMVSARVAQGAFGALLIPQGVAIMTKTFPREALTTAFAAFGPMLGVFSVAGPILGGFLIQADLAGLGWRPVFLVNVVLGGSGLLLAVRVLPTVAADRSVRIDGLGSILLAGAVFGLLLGLVRGSTDGWTPLPAVCLVGAVVLGAAFARRQLTTTHPLITPSLFTNRGFTSGMIAGLLIFAAFNGLMYVISLFFQLGLGYSPLHASLSLLPLTLGIIAGAGACMALVTRLGRTLVLAGLLTSAAGAALLLVVVRTAGTGATWWQLASVTLLIGAGAGACFGSVFDTALGDTTPEQAGAASGSLSAVQQIAAGAGSAIITSLYLGHLGGGQVGAMTTSLVAVLGIIGLCVMTLPLLPRVAARPQH
jgi:EmrB/QacA subfamily drug resistance transporter